MLSVLIPVYNYDVTDFINSLDAQCGLCGIDYEIICMDDASDSSFISVNSKINLPNFQFIQLENNIGRAAIRNKLAEAANFENLLFADCDSMIDSSTYIKDYVQVLEEANVIYGGRSYEKQPQSAEFLLHWEYGRNRECRSIKQRRGAPYDSFMTNNFLVKKTVLNSIPFDETIRTYGHEDTLFGLLLKGKKIRIKHIDNPLVHVGLDKTEKFLKKTEAAVSNLADLYKRDLLGNEVRLIRAYEGVKRIRLLGLVRRIIKRKEQSIVTNLKSNRPKLKNLDKLKLMWLIENLAEVK